MFHGAAYRFLVTRELLSRKTEQIEISIDVPPGVRSGTRIVCPNTGHQRKDGTLQNVVFVIEGVSHGRFSRVRDDLFIDICVPWVETLAEQGGDICLDGIDGEEIIFTLPYPIYDKSTEGEILVKGAGMPIRQDRKSIGRGNLIVRYDRVCRYTLVAHRFSGGRWCSRTRANGRRSRKFFVSSCNPLGRT
jgi:DnaJ-class molecular chaperone